MVLNPLKHFRYLDFEAKYPFASPSLSLNPDVHREGSGSSPPELIGSAQERHVYSAEGIAVPQRPPRPQSGLAGLLDSHWSSQQVGRRCGKRHVMGQTLTETHKRCINWTLKGYFASRRHEAEPLAGSQQPDK